MIWSQTSSGVAFDLLNPRAEDVDFINDVAPALARNVRYAGNVPTGQYSIAQHCALGCDAAMQETGRTDIAAAFLLHDAHEFIIGDITSPTAEAIDALVSIGLRTLTGEKDKDRKALGKSLFRSALGQLKGIVDKAIFAAAGEELPTPEIAKAVHAMDLRMLKVERDQLCAAPPRPWHPSIEGAKPVPLRGKIKLWPWPVAADEWLKRLRQYCPHANGF